MDVQLALQSAKAIVNERGQFAVAEEASPDGLAYEVKNWGLLVPVLEALISQDWFPQKDWTQQIIEKGKGQDVLPLSLERLQQLHSVVAEVNSRITLIMGVWGSVSDNRDSYGFRAHVAEATWPDFANITECLDKAFKILAVDNPFTVVVSGGFILVVPGGPAAHYCAVFALHMAYKSIELLSRQPIQHFRELSSHLPQETGVNLQESDIEVAVEGWLAAQLDQEWAEFGKVQQEFFPGIGNARANTEKAIPILRELLAKEQCYIEPPASSYTEGQDSTGDVWPSIEQLNSAVSKSTQVLMASGNIAQFALKAKELIAL